MNRKRSFGFASLLSAKSSPGGLSETADRHPGGRNQPGQAALTLRTCSGPVPLPRALFSVACRDCRAPWRAVSKACSPQKAARIIPAPSASYPAGGVNPLTAHRPSQRFEPSAVLWFRVLSRSGTCEALHHRRRSNGPSRRHDEPGGLLAGTKSPPVAAPRPPPSCPPVADRPPSTP